MDILIIALLFVNEIIQIGQCEKRKKKYQTNVMIKFNQAQGHKRLKNAQGMKVSKSGPEKNESKRLVERKHVPITNTINF